MKFTKNIRAPLLQDRAGAKTGNPKVDLEGGEEEDCEPKSQNDDDESQYEYSQIKLEDLIDEFDPRIFEREYLTKAFRSDKFTNWEVMMRLVRARNFERKTDIIEKIGDKTYLCQLFSWVFGLMTTLDLTFKLMKESANIAAK